MSDRSSGQDIQPNDSRGEGTPLEEAGQGRGDERGRTRGRQWDVACPIVTVKPVSLSSLQWTLQC